MESKTSAENTEKEKDKKGPNQENAQPNTAGQNNPQNNAQKEETKSKLNEVLDTFFKPDDKKLSINLFLEKSKSDGGLYKQSIKKESEKTNEQNEEKLEINWDIEFNSFLISITFFSKLSNLLLTSILLLLAKSLRTYF